MRNPVINLNAMLDETDIPDWVLAEAGLTERDPVALHAASPIRYVDRVTAPTIVALGLKDLRVPPSQGRGWYRAIKRGDRGVDVRLFEYPEDHHGLDGVHAMGDLAVHTALLFVRESEAAAAAAE
eukprot:Rhum_TRINITY_DN10554_c0_g2::Rhum_TRINITY_DN10554_c0_g2_i1::g.38998::m.38998